MKPWQIFLPHIALLFAIALALILAAWGFPHRGLSVALVLALGAAPLAVILIISYLPAVESAMLVTPQGNPAKATQAIVLCFSYEGEIPSMRPGPANVELLAYVRNAMPNVRTILVQEGVWVAVPGAPQAPQGPNVLRVADVVAGKEIARNIVRFHRHDPKRYLNTLEAIYCASRVLDPHQVTVLVSHELQLKRAAWDLRKVCSKCQVVIPPIHGISFVPAGTHLQARSKALYKLIELFLSRPRDYFARPPVSSPLSLEACCGGSLEHQQ
jgi:hypothetical protein